MASDSDMSDIEQSLSKIRKDYLKLDKAKLSKKCKALNVDAYGSKAVLVEHLMKEHEKRLSHNKPKHTKHIPLKQTKKKKNKPSHKTSPKSPKSPKCPSNPFKLQNIDRSKSRRVPYIRKRSRSINIIDIKNNKPKINMHKNMHKNMPKTPKSRRSSMAFPIKNRKDLLKMSKNEIIKQCRLQHVNVSGLRNKNEMINKLVNIEELFQERKKRNMDKINTNNNAVNTVKSKVKVKKKKQDGLSRSKSQDVILTSVIQRGKSKRYFVNIPTTPVTKPVKLMQPPAAVTLPLLKHEMKEEEIDVGYFMDLECDLRQCVSRRRLIGALKYYEDNYNEQGKNDDMIREFMGKYKYLLSDWHHLLLAHLDCKLSENFQNFNVLYDDIKKQHLLCDIYECSHYIKNNRNREDVHVDEENDDIDLNSRFIMDLIGSIHVYLVHSFDIGFRLRNYKQFGMGKKDDEKGDGCDEYKYLYFDDEMESFQEYYDLKRKELEKMRGVQRVKQNKYFTYIDHDGMENGKIGNKLEKVEEKMDVESKIEVGNNMNLSSLMECNTKQIVRILKEYFFADIKSDILNHYRKKIIGYFEENDWNGIELSKMTQIAFVTELVMRCDNNKKLKPDLEKLFNLFDFTDLNDEHSTKTTETQMPEDRESETEIKHITGCNHDEIMNILKNHLFDKINNQLLHEHREKIIQYFIKNNIDGITLFDMKRKKFCENMIKYCNNNRKLNHSFIVLYKEFFKIDLSQIVSLTHENQINSPQNDDTMTFPTTPLNGEKRKKPATSGSYGSLEKLMNTKGTNKRRKRRGSVEPQFTSGYRFLYWQYYQNDKWFVHKKYSNLKEEILDNIVHSLNPSKWDEAYNKALYIKQSEIIKNIKCEMDKWSEIYGIPKDTPLKISHLLSIILYTDYIDLAFDFSKSFKKLSFNESNEELRDRNGEFANWARCLREIVECFGCRMKDSKVDIFYYGISEQFVFNSFMGRFYAPTSTTIQPSVTKLFSPQQNGIILELQKYKGGLELTYFNCSLISNFSYEDERLFIGGYRPLQFHGIRVLSKHENYMWFITALTIFNDFLNGKKLTVKKMKSLKSTHYMIINKLCQHKASINRNDNKLSNIYFRNTFPDYINNIFDSYCNKKKQININLKWLNQCCPGFKSYFTESVSNDNLKTEPKRKRVTFVMSDGSITPGGISTKPKQSKQQLDNLDDISTSYRKRRRHSISGSMIQTDVINGKYLFEIFKYINPIHVMTEVEGVSYDIIPTLPNLLFVYKLNDKQHPISIDKRVKKDFDSSMQFRKNINIIYIENPLYKYYLNKDFYIKHILQILCYFFDSKLLYNKKDEKKNMSINNNGIAEILKWKFNTFKNKIKFAAEIYKYFNDKKEIYININRLKMCSEASSCLLHEKCKRLCFFNIVSSLFVKCEKIICYDIRVVSPYYLQELLIILQNANKNKYYKLKHIVLYQPLKVQVNDQEFAKFKQKFVRHNWKITKKLHNNNRNDLYLCFDKIVLRR